MYICIHEYIYIYIYMYIGASDAGDPHVLRGPLGLRLPGGHLREGPDTRRIYIYIYVI